jgi:hypothetical protein
MDVNDAGNAPAGVHPLQSPQQDSVRTNRDIYPDIPRMAISKALQHCS